MRPFTLSAVGLTLLFLFTPIRSFTQSASNTNVTQIQTELVFVTQFGVAPTQITRPKGKFFLEVLNRTWDPAADIAFQRAPSNKAAVDLTGIIDSDGFKHKRHSVGLADLASGDYQLVDASGNVLTQITIQ